MMEFLLPSFAYLYNYDAVNPNVIRASFVSLKFVNFYVVVIRLKLKIRKPESDESPFFSWSRGLY
jgi:hypothetical protein